MPTPPSPHPDAPAPGTILPSHYNYCYGCGRDHPSGLHLRVQVGEGTTVRGWFLVGEDHQGAAGLVHGGVLAAAFDEVMGAVNWLLLVPAVTGRLEVDFRAPVPVGSEVVIDSRVDSLDGRKVDCSAVGTLADGTVVAQARGLFIQVPIEHFAKHGRHAEGPEGSRLSGRAGWELNP